VYSDQRPSTLSGRRRGPEEDFRWDLEPGWEHAGSGSETGRAAFGWPLSGKRATAENKVEKKDRKERKKERENKLIYLICSAERVFQRIQNPGGGWEGWG
jgi:hypothetical protein